MAQVLSPAARSWAAILRAACSTVHSALQALPLWSRARDDPASGPATECVPARGFDDSRPSDDFAFLARSVRAWPTSADGSTTRMNGTEDVGMSIVLT
jgi:hypothetical protein